MDFSWSPLVLPANKAPVDLWYVTPEALAAFVKAALAEDVGGGDYSSMGVIPAGSRKKAEIIVKDEGTIAGLELAKFIFRYADPNVALDTRKQDGDRVADGQVAMVVSGDARSILMAERLVLNCLQRMSGIATYTRKMTELIEGLKTRILDTRKTTPNFRLAEKWAVAIGGGVNHRYGLYDMVMLKDNHIDYAGGVREAVESAQRYLRQRNLSLDIEVEVRNLNELAAVLEIGGVKRVMLDNMPPLAVREAVGMVAGRLETEASGGITEANLRTMAETGVDYISLGVLTHSYRSLDMSLKAI